MEHALYKNKKIKKEGNAKFSGMYNKTPTDFGSSQLPVDEDRDGPRSGGLLAIKPPHKDDRPRIFFGVK